MSTKGIPIQPIRNNILRKRYLSCNEHLLCCKTCFSDNTQGKSEWEMNQYLDFNL